MRGKREGRGGEGGGVCKEGHVSKEKMHVGERFSFLSSFLGGDFNLVVIQRERERVGELLEKSHYDMPCVWRNVFCKDN